MDYLFDLELQYRKDVPAFAEGGKIGEYMGSGEGMLRGEMIEGAVRWDLFEKRSGNICDTNFIGQVVANDGITMGFQILGFFVEGESNRWRLSGGLHFDAEAKEYAGVFLVDGNFDMQTGKHKYKIYRGSST